MCAMNSQGSAASSAALPGRIGPAKLAVAALAGALATWIIIVNWYPFYFSGMSFAPGVAPTPEQAATLRRQNWVNTLSVFAIFGATVSAGMAAVTALERRSIGTAMIAIPCGVVVGGAFGALGGWCGQQVSDPSLVDLIDRSRPEAELAMALIVHAVCWALTGLGVGLGFALTALSGREKLYASLGAALGGLLAAPCYQLVAVLVCLIWPMGGTDMLVPEGNENRLIWFTTAALMIAIGTGGLGTRKKKPVTPTAAPQPAAPQPAAPPAAASQPADPS